MPNPSIATQASGSHRRLHEQPFVARAKPENAIAGSNRSATSMASDFVEAQLLKPIRHAVSTEHEQLYTSVGNKVYESANGSYDWIAKRIGHLGYLGNNDGLNRMRKHINDQFISDAKGLAVEMTAKEEPVTIDLRHTAVSVKHLSHVVANYTMVSNLNSMIQSHVLNDVNRRIARMDTALLKITPHVPQTFLRDDYHNALKNVGKHSTELRTGVDANAADEFMQRIRLANSVLHVVDGSAGTVAAVGDATLLEVILRHAQYSNNRYTKLDAKLDQHYTKLDSQSDQQSAIFNAKLDQQSEKLDARLDQQSAKFDAKLDQQSSKFNARLDQQYGNLHAKTDQQYAAIDKKIKLLQAEVAPLKTAPMAIGTKIVAKSSALQEKPNEQQLIEKGKGKEPAAVAKSITFSPPFAFKPTVKKQYDEFEEIPLTSLVPHRSPDVNPWHTDELSQSSQSPIPLSEMASQLQSTASELASIHQTVADLKRNVKDVSTGHWASHQSVLRESENLGEKMNSRLNKIDKHVGSIDTQVGTLDKHVGMIDSQIGTLDKHVGAIDSQVVSLDKHVGTLDSQVVALDKHVGAIDSQVSTLDKHIGTIDTQVASIEKHIGVIETQVGTMAKQFDEIGKQFDAMKMYVDTMEARMLAFEQRLQNINQSEYHTAPSSVD